MVVITNGFSVLFFLGYKVKKRDNGKDTRVELAKTFINTDHFMVHVTVFPTSHILQSQTGQRIYNKMQSKRPDFPKKSMSCTDSFLGGTAITYHYLRRQSHPSEKLL